MTLLNFEGAYKEKVINLLIKNALLVKLINPTPNKTLDDIYDVLLGGEWIINGEQIKEQGHIFDHDFVDDTTTQEKVFMFIETQIPSVNSNTGLVDINLYITIFAKNRLVNLTNISSPTKSEMKKLGYKGNRVDMLCAIVDNILNGKKTIGLGKVSPATSNFSRVYIPKTGYYGKQLTYTIKGYNTSGDECDALFG